MQSVLPSCELNGGINDRQAMSNESADQLRAEHRKFLGMGKFSKHLSISNTLSSIDVNLLSVYGHWLEALAAGTLDPFTAAQQRFVACANGECAPQTNFEVAWASYIAALAPRRRTTFQDRRQNIDPYSEQQERYNELSRRSRKFEADLERRRSSSLPKKLNVPSSPTEGELAKAEVIYQEGIMLSKRPNSICEALEKMTEAVNLGSSKAAVWMLRQGNELRSTRNYKQPIRR